MKARAWAHAGSQLRQRIARARVEITVDVCPGKWSAYGLRRRQEGCKGRVEETDVEMHLWGGRDARCAYNGYWVRTVWCVGSSCANGAGRRGVGRPPSSPHPCVTPPWW